MCPHVILMPSLYGRNYYYLYFTNAETEAEAGLVAFETSWPISVLNMSQGPSALGLMKVI